jgi:hypothetical protein
MYIPSTLAGAATRQQQISTGIGAPFHRNTHYFAHTGTSHVAATRLTQFPRTGPQLDRITSNRMPLAFARGIGLHQIFVAIGKIPKARDAKLLTQQDSCIEIFKFVNQL